MQSTTRLHDGIANPVLQETYLVFPHPVAFHSANRVFDTDADGRNRTMSCLLRWSEFPPRGFFLGWKMVIQSRVYPWNPHILIQATSVWEGRRLQIGQAFVVGLPFIGGTQEAEMTGLIDHEEVFDRVTLLLATVVVLLVFWIGRAMDRTFGTIMPKRGDVGVSCVCMVARRMAHSSAVRAGSMSWLANAKFNVVWRRCIHLLAFD